MKQYIILASGSSDRTVEPILGLDGKSQYSFKGVENSVNSFSYPWVDLKVVTELIPTLVTNHGRYWSFSIVSFTNKRKL
jgi:hypothetical protein